MDTKHCQTRVSAPYCAGPPLGNPAARMKPKQLSVVIPLFNEEQTLPELWSRLSAVLLGSGVSFEVIFVNDGSRDNTLSALRALAAAQPQVKFLSLSRNFGHGSALCAGLEAAGGDVVVLMDGDLQDRPEAIPDFLAKLAEGFDVAYAIRSSREEGFASRVAFKGFYQLLQRMSSIQQPLDAGIFCAMSRRVVDAIHGMPEHNRYFPGLRAFAGFRQCGVQVPRDARFAGTTRVGAKGLLRLAMDALFGYSSVPIRIVSALGGLVMAFTSAYLMVVLWKRLVSHTAITGWSSTLCVILFLGGTQLLFLGVLGEYISRIYDEAKRRPSYLVDERVNFTPPARWRPGREARGFGRRDPRRPRLR